MGCIWNDPLEHRCFICCTQWQAKPHRSHADIWKRSSVLIFEQTEGQLDQLYCCRKKLVWMVLWNLWWGWNYLSNNKSSTYLPSQLLRSWENNYRCYSKTIPVAFSWKQYKILCNENSTCQHRIFLYNRQNQIRRCGNSISSYRQDGSNNTKRNMKMLKSNIENVSEVEEMIHPNQLL